MAQNGEKIQNVWHKIHLCIQPKPKQLNFGKKSKLLHNNLGKGCQLEFTLNALYIGETKNKNKVWTGAIEHHY